jgi:hypothetical protein
MLKDIVVDIEVDPQRAALAAASLSVGEVVDCAVQETIIEGTVVACFGAVRELRKGELGTRTRIGYSFIVRETGGRTLETRLVRASRRNVWRTQLTTLVTLILRIASLCTRESQGIRVGWDRRRRGV